MNDVRYKLTICREGQPAHQMAEMSMTLSADMLSAILAMALDQAGEPGSLLWGEAGPQDFGKFRSLTIAPAEPG